MYFKTKVMKNSVYSFEAFANRFAKHQSVTSVKDVISFFVWKNIYSDTSLSYDVISLIFNKYHNLMRMRVSNNQVILNVNTSAKYCKIIMKRTDNESQ